MARYSGPLQANGRRSGMGDGTPLPHHGHFHRHFQPHCQAAFGYSGSLCLLVMAGMLPWQILFKFAERVE